MKPEEIIALAKEAGIKLGYVCGKPDQCPDDDNCCHHNTREGFWASDGQLSRFAARIRDMTLEEAADLVFKMANHIDYEYQWTGLHRAQDAIRKLKGVQQ